MKYGFLILFAVFTALAAYVVLRGYQALRDFSILRNVYLAAAIAMFVVMIGGMILPMFMHLPFAKTIAFIGHSCLIVFVYLLLSFLLVDIVRMVNYFAYFAPEGMFVFRRWAFLLSLAVIAAAMIAGNYKFNHPKTAALKLAVEGKPRQNRKLRIVAASDIHLGVSIDKKRLQKYVEMINELKPDVVLFAGDIVDNVLEPVIRQRMYEDFLKIEAPLGVYAVPGNHEYIGGDVEAAAACLRKGNVVMLRDSAVLVDNSFYLIGRDDRTNKYRKPLAVLAAGLDASKPFIMMDHQPYHLEEAEEAGIDLQLSGHTHNGQFFPGNLIVKAIYENGHGYSARGRTHYYVSSGLGLWGPQYRIGTQSELIVVELDF